MSTPEMRAIFRPFSLQPTVAKVRRGSALALLVARVFADDHHAAVPADHLALLTNLLDARSYLHDQSILFARNELLFELLSYLSC
jgi:hypothetical protein